MGVSDFIRSIDKFEICLFFVFSDLHACFDYLCNLVKGTPSEPLLSSIINRLICIRDDPAIRLVRDEIFRNRSFSSFRIFSHNYLRLIDDCITRIVFSKTACDPDFDTYSMDSESIGDSGFGINDNSSTIRSGSSHDLPQVVAGTTTNNLTATENEIQINLMKGRVEHLEHTREKLTKALETVLAKVREVEEEE